MAKNTKIWLIIAASFVLIGSILFVIVMSMLNWDFTKLSTVNYVTNEHVITEKFDNISINTDTADVKLLPFDGNECRVECVEDEKEIHSAKVENGTLVIKINSEKKWYDYIGINIGSPKITVYLPEREYEDLTVKGSTGDINVPDAFGFESADLQLSTGNVSFFASTSGLTRINTSTGDILAENISAGAIELTASTGHITVNKASCSGDMKINVDTGKTTVTDVECNSFASTGTTGELTMKNVVAAEKLTVERSTGDVEFENCDAAEIYIKTDTGDVKGSLLSDKVFIVETDTGRIDVPKTIVGGRCECSTDTGDIKIWISRG